MSMSKIEALIADQAEEDGQYAIAWALLQVAYQLKCLGLGDAATPMGAMEVISLELKKLTGAIEGLVEDRDE